MLRYGISASLEKLPDRQPVTLRGDIETICRLAKETGYDALELHIRRPAQYDAEEIRRMADRYGLPICAVANGMEYTMEGLSLIDDDPAARNAAVGRVLEHVDFASDLGAMLIVGIMRGNIPGDGDPGLCRNRFTESLRTICAEAAQKQVTVVLESITRYINNYLNSVPETIDYILSLKIPNLLLHLDTHSMAIEEKNLAESIRYCRGKPLGYVHYSDNNRRYPGGGTLDFRELTRVLLDIGYDGYITVECLPDPDPVESARRGLLYMKSVEDATRLERIK